MVRDMKARLEIVSFQIKVRKRNETKFIEFVTSLDIDFEYTVPATNKVFTSKLTQAQTRTRMIQFG